MNSYMVATIHDSLSIMDAHLDAFEVRVRHSLSMARLANLMAIQTEIQQLQADMTVALIEPVTLPETTIPVPVVDHFVPDEYIQPSHIKRPNTYDDENVICSRGGLTEQLELKLVLRESREGKER